MHPDPGPWQTATALCILLMILITSASPEGTPRLISEPISTVQKPGGAVTLICSVEPREAHISWLLNGNLLDTTLISSIEVQAGQLTIPSLGPTQAGWYQCIANTSRGAIISNRAIVSLANLEDSDTSARLTVTAEDGSSAFINCHIPHSNPKARVRYRVRNLFWLEESTDKFIILPSGNLQIVNVSSNDQGTYKCEAINPLTHTGRKTQHRLTVRPSSHNDSYIILPTVSQTHSVHLHEPVSLECVVVGPGIPRVRWYKDGQDVRLLGRRKLLHTHLVIDKVERADAGNYSCVLENDTRGLRRVNYTVIVLEPPSLSRLLVDQSSPAGGTVQFTCEAQGFPAPNITWLHNAVPVHTSLRHQVLANKLTITNLIADDSGMYQCAAENGVGAAQSAARLIVKSDIRTRPVIVSPPVSVTVMNGELVSLTCNATGVPTPTIRWYDKYGAITSHPSQVLLSKSRRTAAASSQQDPAHVTMSQAGSSTLYIRAVTAQHAGKYVCEASNEHGSVHAEAYLTVVPYELSTRPEDITPSDLTQSDSETLSPDASRPGLRSLANPPPTAKPFNGASLPEAPIILSPPQTTKPHIYNLMWRAGKDGGLPINAYFVRYRKLDYNSNMMVNWQSVRVPASENEFLLTELEPESLYEVLMVARNSAGEGQPAMLTFRTSKERSSSSKHTQAPSPPVGVPKQPVLYDSSSGLVRPDSRQSGVPEAPDRPTISTASETSVYVTWIPRANGGSPITSFKVEYKRMGRLWVTAAEHIPPSKLSVEVSNLEPGATYKFRVIAINIHGDSKRSTPSQAYQVAGYSNRLPNPLIVGPRIDHTEAMTDTSIKLKWTYIPSTNNNTPIQGFYIYYRPTDSDNDSDYQRDQVEGTKHSHLISNLQPETSYDIKMQCFNERGASDYSNVMMCETKARRSPGAPDYPVPDLSTPATFERSGGSNSGVSNALARSSDMLYVIVGCVLGGMVLILMAFIAMCLLKNRQQSLMQKFEPPGYLYQGADLNGQIIEYTTLPGTSLINGSVRGGFMGNGCPHVHHKNHNGTNGVMNGEPYSGCTNTLKPSYMDYECLPHHISNGGVMYTAVPQTDAADCVNCRNCHNNNRCFTKANETNNGSAVPMVSAVLQDNMEGKPLNHVLVPMSVAPSDHQHSVEMESNARESVAPPSPQPISETESAQMDTESQEGDDHLCTEEENTMLSWSPLTLLSMPWDCNGKSARTIPDITLGSCGGDCLPEQTSEA
ncbi:cell adhesion molecule-related/down-regulated by oncogenes [Bombina bombina]|uniref:cell adhesion molecule-related/down-regulated by oncogenes n=1 Tax=Bombina bombina TaxID=8345 RepID=UPI00235AC35F|nr:cell adhesion molecule-related/down-regulated by oncogenes [Bombina bombina]XP_053547377.1 cell adhesion molecule-related/down-regulated by oncogenes [Bombina bombina]